jgi:hypothetical protein
VPNTFKRKEGPAGETDAPEGWPSEEWRLEKSQEFYVRRSTDTFVLPLDQCRDSCTGRGVCLSEPWRTDQGPRCVCRKASAASQRPEPSLLDPSHADLPSSPQLSHMRWLFGGRASRGTGARAMR